MKGIIEKGVYKSLAGSKQFEEIVRKQGRHRKNQGVGFERKFNANGVEWEEDLPPQDHKLKGKDKLQEEIDSFEEAPQAMVKWVPKTSSIYTSSSATTTPRIPIKLMWVQKKKN